MKGEHKQAALASQLEGDDAQPELTGQPVRTAKETEFLDETWFLTVGALHPAAVEGLEARGSSAWWEEEDPETRTGGVCLLIA